MPMKRSRAAGWMVVCLSLIATHASAADAPAFEHEVRPILSRYCVKCHGPDEGQRLSGLRLDVRESAMRSADSRKLAIVPGTPDSSELIRRINLPDGSGRLFISKAGWLHRLTLWCRQSRPVTL